MKYILENRIHRLSIPWYLRPLTIYHYEDRSCEIGIFPVLKFWIRYWWYKLPQAIMDYNTRNCINFIPDYMTSDGGAGEKIRPWFGYFLNPEENARIHWMWWKHLQRISQSHTCKESDTRNEGTQPKQECGDSGETKIIQTYKYEGEASKDAVDHKDEEYEVGGEANMNDE